MNRRILIFLLAGLCITQLPAQKLIRPGSDVKRYAPRQESLPISELPRSFDNSYSPYFPPIVSQDGGSCAQASGIHYLFTYEMNRYLDRPCEGKAENIFSYHFIWNFLNGGTGEGGFVTDGLNLVRRQGCVTEADFPGRVYYTAYPWPSGYDIYERALHYRIHEIIKIDVREKGGLEHCLNYFIDRHDGLKGGGILSFSLLYWDYEDYDGPSQSGYKCIVIPGGDTDAPHAMTLVGYDLDVCYDADGDGEISEMEKGAFILVNSWGTWWGTEGRAYIPFYYFIQDEDKGGLEGDYATVIGTTPEYVEPELIYRLNIRYTSRNDLRLELGVNDGINQHAPKSTAITYPVCISGSGGDLPMGGKGAVIEGVKMSFDYSKASQADDMRAPNYFATLTQTAVGKVGNGELQYLEVLKKEGDSYRSLGFIKPSKTEGALKGRKTWNIATADLVKTKDDLWYAPIETSVNPLRWSQYIEKGPIQQNFILKCADGSFAKLKVAEYKDHVLKLDITHRRDGDRRFDQ